MDHIEILTGIISRGNTAHYTGTQFGLPRGRIIEEREPRSWSPVSIRVWVWNQYLGCYDPILDTVRDAP